MSDELRAAAERIANPQIVWPDSLLGAGYRDICHEDAMAVARAYLTEHPADDDELVTSEWFAELGDAKWGKTIGIYWSESGPTMHIESDETNHRNFRFPLNVRTRGDVRSLLAALGITPK